MCRIILFWGLSSAGRASALQAEGHRFEPCRSHLFADVAHFVKINERSEVIAGRAADCKSAADIVYYAYVAQLAEHLICNQQVIGSSPIIGFMDGFPSGQRGQTVNLLSVTSVVRIHPHPFQDDLTVIFFIRGAEMCSWCRGVEQSGSSSGS